MKLKLLTHARTLYGCTVRREVLIQFGSIYITYVNRIFDSVFTMACRRIKMSDQSIRIKKKKNTLI